MKTCLVNLCFVLTCVTVFAQSKISGVSTLPIQVNVSDPLTPDLHPSLIQLDQHPIPSAEYGNKKDLLNQFRTQKEASIQKPIAKKVRGLAPDPIVYKGFEGNASGSTPNDNDIAVSNNGTVVSVVNSSMRVLDDTGKILLNKSLTNLVAPAGVYSWISDPRVLYDPKEDKFILVCFSGSLSNESTILVCFSQTNDPTGVWNVYTLNGNQFNDSTWSDYPIIAISDKDLFMTFNQVKDNVSWTIGFKQSVIWQIDKESGFTAQPLLYDLWSDIKYQDKNLRNICPAKYQTNPMGNNMYFLTVRNVDMSNDSIFVTEITDSKSSGQATINQRVLKSPVAYGFPPNARQKYISPNITQYLMTNDARVLAAIYENDHIYFGSNTVNPVFMNAAVYLGTISQISSASPQVSADIFSTSTMEYGYPSMTWLGQNANDHKILYTFSHCITDSFPGTSVLYKDANNNYSDIVAIRNGTSIINRLTDSIERWGDYTNIQKMYNNSNRAYLSGSWGKSNANRTWIAAIDNADFPTTVNNFSTDFENTIYPNPIEQASFTTTFKLEQSQHVRFEILDMQGKLISLLLDTNVKKGEHEFSFQTGDLPAGMYLFQIRSLTTTLASHKILKK